MWLWSATAHWVAQLLGVGQLLAEAPSLWSLSFSSREPRFVLMTKSGVQKKRLEAVNLSWGLSFSPLPHPIGQSKSRHKTCPDPRNREICSASCWKILQSHCKECAYRDWWIVCLSLQSIYYNLKEVYGTLLSSLTLDTYENKKLRWTLCVC